MATTVLGEKTVVVLVMRKKIGENEYRGTIGVGRGET